MKKITWFTALLILTASSVHADRFVLPADYDNLLEEKKSHGKLKIYNEGTAIWSDDAYSIGGRTLHYRCGVAKKIVCAPSGSEVLAEVGITKMLSSDGKVATTYQTDIKVEDKGLFYKICIATFGGLLVDDISLEQEQVSDFQTKVTLNYKPNDTDKSAWYYFFTDADPVEDRGAGESYIEIDHQQVCR